MADNSNYNRLFQSAGQQKQQTGTGYTNLNKFFQANQNNKLGQKVSGNIQSQIGQVKGQLGQQQEQFKTEAEKNRLDTEENKQQRDQAIGRFQNPSTAGGDVTDQDINKFQQFRSGQYAGPSGLQDTQALSGQANELRAQTSNLSPEATQELLRRSVGGAGRYTQGQQRLDTLLMDRSGLRQAGREASGLSGDINRANLAAQGQAQTFKSQAQQFGNETTERLKQAMTGLDTSAEQQLASAQQAEKDRLARIQAVQDFAAGKVAKKDASGNVMKDQYGNTIYDTINPRGSGDQYAQMDQLTNLLRSQGANEEEIGQLIGSTGSFTGLKGELNAIEQQKASITPRINQLKEMMRYIEESGRHASSQVYANAKKELSGLTSQINNLNSQIAPLYQSRGIAGQALQAGASEDFYTNLAKSLANSQSAQGLNLQGIASDPLRQNYSALQQLLGQTPDLAKYRDTDERYQAGQFLLNPDLVRRATLG
jgi:uncharacterized protein YjbJ (UPF0337 family)